VAKSLFEQLFQSEVIRLANKVFGFLLQTSESFKTKFIFHYYDYVQRGIYEIIDFLLELKNADTPGP